MFSNLVNIINKSLNTAANLTPVKQATPKQQKDANPFNNNINPFLSTTFGSSKIYGKNQPVSGGYFAGYYNGVPNIVGRKLFIEV